MFLPFANVACLAFEANQVIWLRMTQLQGLPPVQVAAEVNLMVTEKFEAGCRAMTSLASGHSSDEVVTAYRDVVQANLKRLSA